VRSMLFNLVFVDERSVTRCALPPSLRPRLPAPIACPYVPYCSPRLPSFVPASQGDNNWGDDRSLYPKGQLWLNPNHIMGKVVG